MKRRILIFGSIMAVVILVLASFPSVVGAQTMESIVERRTSMTQYIIKDIGVYRDWKPGYFIILFLAIPIDIILMISYSIHEKQGTEPGLFFIFLSILLFILVLISERALIDIINDIIRLLTP